MTMSRAARLRQLLRAEPIVQAPGAYDGLTATLIEQAGFPAVYMTGAGTSAAQGFPDYGLLTLTEMVDNAAIITRSVGVPVISDADTGYGNELNVTRTVREFEARGVAAIHIEDQVAPKRCGHLDGKEVVSREEFEIKIRAAAAARRDRDFMIIARTDARAVLGMDEAIARARLAIAVGADMAFVEAVESIEEMARIPGLVEAPCLLNVVPGGKTPLVSMTDAQAMGYRLAIFPGLSLRSTVIAVDAALDRLRNNGIADAPQPGGSVLGGFRRVGADDWDAIRVSGRKGDGR
jgi:2-methylisocitrate lyase-like PEP mutase family enzyme